MKHLFLWAVIISAFCSSCETADEYTQTEQDSIQNNKFKSNSVVNSDYNLYRSILAEFNYNHKQTYQNNLLRFERHVNDKMVAYNTGNHTYQKIDMIQLALLNTNTYATTIGTFLYTQDMKNAIGSLIRGEIQNINDYNHLGSTESKLLSTLWLFNNDDDDDDDDNYDQNQRHMKTIAFAYGAQHSLTKSILYAGAIELKNKVNN